MNKHNLKIDATKSEIFLASRKKQQEKSKVINANYNIKRILQTLHLRGRCGHKQVAETKETGPGSLLFFLKQNGPVGCLEHCHLMTMDSSFLPSLIVFLVFDV